MKPASASGLTTAAKLAAGSAIGLLLVMAVFNWFETDAGAVNAWQAFTIIDLILLLAAAAGIALALTGAGPTGRPQPIALAVASLGLLAVTLIAFRIIDPPDLDASAITKAVDVFGVDGSSVKLGAWLGLFAAAGIAWGGWAATTAEAAAGSSRLRGGSERAVKRPAERPPSKPRPTRPAAAAADLAPTRTAAQRAAERAERRRRSQSSSG